MYYRSFLAQFFFNLPTWTTVALPVFSTVCHLKQRTQLLNFSKKIPVCMTLRTVDIRITREKTASCPKRRRRVEYLPSLRDVSGFASSMFHKCFKHVSKLLQASEKQNFAPGKQADCLQNCFLQTCSKHVSDTV